MEFLITIGIILAIILFAIGIPVIAILVIFDDVKEIDNSDGHIICGNTGQPCIKDTLYTKCNYCAGCPYENGN